MPEQQMRARPAARRAWWLDALSAIAFLVLTIVVARPLARVNFLFGLFAFALLGGMTYFFAKSAWRGIIEGREQNDERGGNER